MLAFDNQIQALDGDLPTSEMAVRIAALSQVLGGESLAVAKACDGTLADGLVAG